MLLETIKHISLPGSIPSYIHIRSNTLKKANGLLLSGHLIGDRYA